MSQVTVRLADGRGLRARSTAAGFALLVEGVWLGELPLRQAWRLAEGLDRIATASRPPAARGRRPARPRAR